MSFASIMKKSKLLVFFFLISAALFAQTNPSPIQTKFYQHGYSKKNGESLVKALMYGANTYVLLNITDSMDVDFGPGTSYFSPEFAGNSAMVLVVYDINGNFLWGKLLGQGTSTEFGANFVQAETMQFIDRGIVITGTANNAIQLDPARSQAGAFNVSNKTFIASYTINGDFKWAKVQQIGFAYYKTVAIDKDQEFIYILGYSYGVSDIDLGAGNVPVGTPTNHYTTFVLTLNTSGEYVGHFEIKPDITSSNPGSNLPEDMIITGGGKGRFVLISGTYSGSIIAGTDLRLNAGENKKGAYIIRQNSTGTLSLLQKLSSTENLSVPGLSITTVAGEITGYQISGTFSNDLQIRNQSIIGYGSNNKDLFVARFNLDDSLSWVKTIAEQGQTESLKMLSGRFILPGSSSPSNMIIIGGTTSKTGELGDDLNPGNEVIRINSPRAAFILYFNELGEMILHNKIENLQMPGSFQFGNIDADYLGNFLISGNFQFGLDIEDFPYLNDSIYSKDNTLDYFVKRFHYCSDSIQIASKNGTLEVIGNSGNSGAEFLWINLTNGNIVKKSQEAFYSPTEAGKYLAIRIKDACRALSNTFEFTSTSLNESTKQSNSIICFPNPVSDKLNLKSDHNLNSSKINLYNISGMYIKTIDLEWINENASFQTSDLIPGMYIIEVNSKQSKNTLYFIKN